MLLKIRLVRQKTRITAGYKQIVTNSTQFRERERERERACVPVRNLSNNVV